MKFKKITFDGTTALLTLSLGACSLIWAEAFSKESGWD